MANEVKKAAPASHVQPRRAERRPDLIRQRKEARRQAYQKQRRQWLLTRIGLGAVVLVILAWVAWLGWGQVERIQDRGLLEEVQAYEGLTNDHRDDVPSIDYEVIPPVGGDHWTFWQTCDYYSQPLINEHAVHSLEHGAVWITYQPDLPQEQVDQLRELAEEQSYILVSPYPDLPAPVVASSWGHQLYLDSADDPALDAYVREYRRHPEYTLEPGASCSGGVTITQ